MQEIQVGPQITDECKTLPANGPVNRPRIINIPRYTTVECAPFFRVWDEIATNLFKHSPDNVTDFLDPAVKMFRFVHEQHRNGRRFGLVIWKKDQDVVVSKDSII
jgi:hypothetical protein